MGCARDRPNLGSGQSPGGARILLILRHGVRRSEVQQPDEVGILCSGLHGHLPVPLDLGNLGGIVGTRRRLDRPQPRLVDRPALPEALARQEPVERQPRSFVSLDT